MPSSSATGYERPSFSKQVVTYLLSLLPIISWLPHYSLSKAQSDLIAGLTVGLMVVPQALAYATIAGLDHQYGLYASFMGVFVYVFLGTAKDITLGPTAIMSLMTASNSDQVDGKTVPSHAIFLTFAAGLVQLGMGLFQLGFLVDFISYPVISGFTSAAAITIGFGQVKHLFGLNGVRRPFVQCVHDTFSKLGDTEAPDVVMGITCFFLLVFLKRLKEDHGEGARWYHKLFWLLGTARNAVVVVLAGLIAYAFIVKDVFPACEKPPSSPDPTYHFERYCITVIKDLPQGMPPVKPPSLDASLWSELAPGIIVIALIGYLESIAIGKAFARENDYKLNPSQELVAIGGANVISSFFSSYPVTGSFSRTAVNSASGVMTPLAGAVTGTIVILALQFMTSLFYYIPQAALAAIIISAVFKMINYQIVIDMWKTSKLDLLPFAVSFFGSLFFGIEYGVLIAVGVSILFLLFFSARPAHRLLIEPKESQMSGPASEAGLIPVKLPHFGPMANYAVYGKVIVFRLGGDLTFSATEFIKDTIEELCELTGAHSCVLEMTRANNLDYTGLAGLESLNKALKKRHGILAVAGAQESVEHRIRRFDKLSDVACFGSVASALATAQSEMVVLSRTVSDDDMAEDQAVRSRNGQTVSGTTATTPLLSGEPKSNAGSINT